jgi:hypothetical protein
MKKLAYLFVALSILSGCAQRVGDFTVATTKNMDIKRSLHRVDEGVRLRGRDISHIIIFIPTGVPNMKEAMDNTIEQKPGAVGLSNVTVKRGGWYIPFIYGQDYFEVEGSPIYEVE